MIFEIKTVAILLILMFCVPRCDIHPAGPYFGERDSDPFPITIT